IARLIGCGECRAPRIDSTDQKKRSGHNDSTVAAGAPPSTVKCGAWIRNDFDGTMRGKMRLEALRVLGPLRQGSREGYARGHRIQLLHHGQPCFIAHDGKNEVNRSPAHDLRQLTTQSRTTVNVVRAVENDQRLRSDDLETPAPADVRDSG